MAGQQHSSRAGTLASRQARRSRGGGGCCIRGCRGMSRGSPCSALGGCLRQQSRGRGHPGGRLQRRSQTCAGHCSGTGWRDRDVHQGRAVGLGCRRHVLTANRRAAARRETEETHGNAPGHGRAECDARRRGGPCRCWRGRGHRQDLHGHDAVQREHWVSSQTLLATFSLQDPVFGSVSAGVATLAGTPITTTGAAVGTAAWFRCATSTPGTRFDSSVTATCCCSRLCWRSRGPPQQLRDGRRPPRSTAAALRTM